MGSIVLTRIREHLLSTRSGFSESQGLSPCNTKMQTRDLDDRTRVILFNIISGSLCSQYSRKDISAYDRYYYEAEDSFFRNVSTSCGKIVDPQKHYFINEFNNVLKEVLTKAFFNEVFDLIELVCKFCRMPQDLIGDVNRVFEQEYVGYRFVDGRIVPITDENEIKSIEEACKSKFEGPRAHIKKAVGFIADRERKDYKNCIKESISAVESICSIIVEDENATLGKAIKQLKDNGLTIHPALEKAFLNLYGYTSDEGGIRHSEGMFESDVTFEEAKFMLVSCSAFVNYLIANYGKVGGKHA